MKKFKIVFNDDTNTRIKVKGDSYQITEYFIGIQFLEILKEGEVVFMSPVHVIKFVITKE